MNMTARIGLFGGSFDPIHNGHLLLAELCRESLALDQVLFVVANVSPFKTGKQMASNKDRIDMVKLAIGGNPSFAVDTREIDRGGVSYTVDTVREILSERPDAQLYLLAGADVLTDIDKWREPQRLFTLVTPCIISRGGLGAPDWERLAPYVDPSRLAEIKASQVLAPQCEISSSNLKSRVASGKSIRYQVPPAVEVFIQEHGLYNKP